MTWVRGFVITDIADIHAEYVAAMERAARLAAIEARLGLNVGGARLVSELKASHSTLNANLRLIAQRGAVNATKGMIERLLNKSRPDKGDRGLKDYVRADVLPAVGGFETGAVGVGRVETLNLAINPFSRGYGPYWRAIEYGTGNDGVRSQVGRILYGSFDLPGGGAPTRPLSEYAGGGGPHPIFISKKSGAGSQLGSTFLGDKTVGLGTIGHEIAPKHFIRFGADEAAVRWRQDVASVQARALSELRGMRLAGS